MAEHNKAKIGHP